MEQDQKKLVSIVLATYNGGRFLQAQLQSLLDQDYRALEIIICDDASTDNTKDIIEQFAAKDNRVSYHINEINLGVNKNFEQGFSKVRGEFIAIADQDDIWKPEKISLQMELFASPEIILVHSASAIFANKIPVNKQEATGAIPMTGNNTRRLLLRNSISGHNLIFRRSLLQHILPIPGSLYYDWWICVVATCVGKIAATNKILAYQRQHDSNVTISHRTTKKQTVKEYEERKKALEEFVKIKEMDTATRNFATELLAQLKTLENKEYSRSYFRFLLRHAAALFFYKTKRFPFFSYYKTAKRMSFAVRTA